jgi:cyclase
MLAKRIVVCLDVKAGRVVKGVGFERLRDVGDPVELATRYESQGADEIVFLDISASQEERGLLLETVRLTASELFIPLTVGGGIRNCDDVRLALCSGADKVSINSAAVRDPGILTMAARRFGSQCVVASIDARVDTSAPGRRWRVYTHGGSVGTALDAVQWARECADRGAGEILLTSIDRDGGRTGYDIQLTAAVCAEVSVPVIASGGAGEPAHVAEALLQAGADAALVAGILHEELATIAGVKAHMANRGITVRSMP